MTARSVVGRTANARATVGANNSGRSGVVSRAATIRISTNGIASQPTVNEINPVNLTDKIGDMVQMADYCKAQYSQCMDNFCNVLDDNQGRCSCSANINAYSKTEQALKAANEELKNVAQKIQYIGLTADEITTLFSQTEAESKMQSTTDATQLKNDLDKIKKMIVDVRSGTATTINDTGGGVDLSNLLDFTVSNTGFDISGIFGGKSNTSSISNQRGESLYKTAAARCKAAVLNTCIAQGVDSGIITNSYDLDIDRACLVYEKNLADSNNQMLSTIRNAQSVLQKARLLVEQRKNEYDLRGCVNALDACMQDDYVCGTDYQNCLDPTGKYIANGEIIVGAEPGVPGGLWDAASSKLKSDESALYMTWNYNNGTKNALYGAGNMTDFISANIRKDYAALAGMSGVTDMVGYLQRKIGYIDSKGLAQGMCSAVFNRCQNATFTGRIGSRKYMVDNPVLTGWLEKVLPTIKKAQDNMLNEYAENCRADVLSCLMSNSATTYNYNASASNGVFSGAAISACMGYIRTCKSVLGYDAVGQDIKDWLRDFLGYDTSDSDSGNNSGGGKDDGDADTTPDYDNTTTYEQDVERCLSLPNSQVSNNGNMCVIYDASSGTGYDYFMDTFVPYVQRMAAQNGGIFRFASLYRGYASSWTARILDAHIGLYVFPSVYRTESEKCTARGGVISLDSNGEIRCKNIPNLTKAECDNLGNEYSYWVQDTRESSSSYSKYVNDYFCSYDIGTYYVGNDLVNSKCVQGALATGNGSGNCVCAPDEPIWAGDKCVGSGATNQ